MGIDKKQRYLMDFVRVGRSGKKFYVFGAPSEWYGPHKTAKEAMDAYDYIVANFKQFEVVDRKLRKKS